MIRAFPNRPDARWLPVLALALCSGLSQAGTVDVHFGDKARFADVREAPGQQINVEQPLQEHLRELGDKLLAADRKLEIDITDIDLAGELEPVGPRMEMLRVMRSHTWPRMTLHYTLRDGAGQALRSADIRLSDMDYQNNARSMGSSEALRYEKQMLSDWFRREFASDGPR